MQAQETDGYNTRIRMECSSLNSHLYSKNIINSPSCSCGGFESAYHFFFVCPIYTQNDLTSIHELACTEEQPLNDMVSFLGRDNH